MKGEWWRELEDEDGGFGYECDAKGGREDECAEREGEGSGSSVREIPESFQGLRYPLSLLSMLTRLAREALLLACLKKVEEAGECCAAVPFTFTCG